MEETQNETVVEIETIESIDASVTDLSEKVEGLVEILTPTEEDLLLEEEEQLQRENLTEQLENIEVMQDNLNELIELSNAISGIDQFIFENGDLILTVLKLICFYGFVGVPLFVVVLFFWTVYKQFLYTNI